MNPHPDSETLLAFREHRLAGSAVVEVALHVGRCGECAKVDSSAGETALAALVTGDAEDHLTDEELDVLVDGRADDPSFRLISRHATACAMCRAEVEDLRRFAAQDREDAGERPSQRWLIAASIAIAVLALSTIALLLRRSEPAPAPVAPVTVNVTPPVARAVASLADAGGRIALLEDGTIAGVEVLSARDADDVRTVLSGRSLSIPTFIAAMPGAVRGETTSRHPLRALEPFRSAVRDARPRLSWSPIREAKSYRVAVFDADYEEIARSEPLNDTSWTPSKPLPAGVDLSWHVVAETDSGEISSAGSDRAEAVFRVLAPAAAEEVARAESQYASSHLLRGLLYSRHGLLHDAEREFRRLAEQNPDSPIVRTLIDSVSR